jgi:hypothetical protein
MVSCIEFSPPSRFTKSLHKTNLKWVRRRHQVGTLCTYWGGKAKEQLELAKAIHCEAQSNVLCNATASSGMGRRSPAPNRGLGMEPVRRHWFGHVWSSSDRFSRPPDQIQGIELTGTRSPRAGKAFARYLKVLRRCRPRLGSGYLSEMRNTVLPA